MKGLRNFLTILCLIFLVSDVICHLDVSASDDNGKESLKQAASKYWNSRLTGDVVACYQLEEPSFRGKVPLSQYAKTGNIIYKEVKVDEIEIKRDEGTVKIKISYIIPGFGSRMVFHDTIVDKWKKVKGNWYHVMRLGYPPMKKTGQKNQKERR